MSTSKQMTVSSKRKINKAQAKQMIRSAFDAKLELKYFINNISGTVADVGSVLPVTQGILPGDEDFERAGSSIFVKEIQMRLTPYVGVNTTSRSEFIRFVLFMDTMNDGSTPTYGQLFSQIGMSTYGPQVFKTKRFKVLADKTYPCGTLAGTSDAHLTNINLKVNRKVWYNGTTDNPSSNGKNSLWLLRVSTQSSANFPIGEADVLILFNDA